MSLSSSRETKFFLWEGKLASFAFFSIILFLPTQFGKHFWPDYSVVYGIRVDYLSPTIYITDILIFLLFVSWIVVLFSNRMILNTKYLILYTKPILLALLCSGLLLIGVFLSKSPAAGLYGFLKLLEVTFFGIFTAWFLKKNPKAYVTVLLMFALGIIAESALAMMQFVNQGSIGGIFYWFGERSFTSQMPGIANASVSGKLLLRPYATFPHPNVLAGYLTLGMLLLASFPLRKSPISPTPPISLISHISPIVFLALILGSVALLLTMSRIAIIVFAICASVVLYKKLPRPYAVTGTIFCLIGFILLFLLLPHRFFPLGFADQTISVRKELFDQGVRMVVAHPLFGVGLNNFLLTLPSFMPQKYSVFFLQPAHNIFLLWISQTGLVGASLAIGFFIALYKRLRIRYMWTQGLVIFTLVVFGSVDHYLLTLQQGQLLLAFFLGLLWGRKTIQR